jgi:hypothetical protein
MYDVYVFASTDTANNPLLSNTIGATTFYYGSDGSFGNSSATSLLLTTSTDPLNPTRGPAQYQRYRNLTGSSFTLTTAGSITGIISNNVFGLHIVRRNPAAVLTRTIPSFAPLGAPDFILRVQGTGFLPDAVVQWNGMDVPTTYISPTEVRAQLTTADLTVRGPARVSVLNPDADPSNQINVPLLNPAVRSSFTVAWDPGTNEVVVTLTLKNQGGGYAHEVTLTRTSLGSAEATTPTLPHGVGTLAPGASAVVVLRFPASVAAGSNLLRIAGSYLMGAFAGSYRINVP